MKAVLFERKPGEPITEPLRLQTFCDSAVVASVRPVFLPDFSERWQLRLLPACRIGRLGKGIGEKFAMRYIDAVSVCLELVPVDYEGAMYGGARGVFDNALIVGKWVECEGGADWSVEFCGLEVKLEWEAIGFERSVSALSWLSTVKNGDIVMPCAVAVEIPVGEGTALECVLNGEKVVDMKLK